jgi:hypothetical protein
MAKASAHYSGDPSTSALDEVRFIVGDTDCGHAKLTDAEILFLIEEFASLASAAAAEQISAQFASSAIVQTGQTRREGNQLSRQYSRLAAKLRLNGGRLLGGVRPYAGGVSHAEKRADWANSDLVQPNLFKNQFDNPRLQNPNPSGQDD